VPKHSVGVGGLWIRIDDEKNERFDGAAPSLFKKAYLLHDSEEVLERSMAEIDDSCTDVGGDQPIKKAIWPRVSPMSATVVMSGK
jgi:hypothetical protein